MQSGFLSDIFANTFACSPNSQRVTVFGILSLIILLGCRHESNSPSLDQDRAAQALSRIRENVLRGNFQAAEREATNALIEHPENVELQLAAAEIAIHVKKWHVAAEHYRALAQRAPGKQKVVLLLSAAKSAARGQKLFDAIGDLENVLQLDPDQQEAHRELAGLQCAMGLEWEATEHLNWLTRKGQAGIAELIVLANRFQSQADESWITDAMKAWPQDLRPTLGLARIAATKDEWAKVKQITDKLLAVHQDAFPAWVLLGRALWELGEQDALRQWYESPFKQAASHPDYWFVLGLIAESQSQSERAAYCYVQCMDRDAFHREAATRLAPLALSLGHDQEAKRTAVHVQELDELIGSVTGFLAWKRDSQAAAIRVSKSMMALGRAWESLGWAKIAVQLKQDPDAQAQSHLRTCLQTVRSDTPLLLPEQLPHHWLDALKKSFSESTIADFQVAASSMNHEQRLRWEASQVPFRFEDEASKRGVDFAFHNGDDPTTPGFWIYQSYGGGVAAFDYDLNGYPDLYFGEAGCDPLASSGPLHDRLFRNQSGEFQDVSLNAQATDDRLTQGVSIGDFNEDGFADIIVANIGENRLYRNNGDGTFQDVTNTAGLSGSRWTSCVCIADLDGDRVNDILEINYCENQRTFTVPCFGGHDNKRLQTCSPTAFGPEPDRFWKGQGDGTFLDATSTTMQTNHPGRGLGVLVTDFDNEPGLEVFVANDMSANHFWKCGSSAWQEQAALRGLANDARGRAQACMGIAAGDPNRDGRLDMLITNFEKEYNAFYVQTRPGFFEDRAVKEGIAAPSFDYLGFGTQFADFDGDQRLDALVANGHVIDVDPKEGDFAMHAQAFTYDRKWHELAREKLGPYFQSKHVGRAMALVDVQEDGWPDVVINHLVEPTALLVNQMPKAGVPLAIELVAIHSARDAVGARVELEQGEGKQVRWRTAGDGFQCSNQPRLWFTIQPEQDCSIQVTWPHGQQQKFTGMKAGHYLIVEGESEPLLQKTY